ncbi:Hydroxyethylthiazole kinase, partial [Tetrabaena socialis]
MRLWAAKRIASQHGCIVAVSGAVDYVTDGVRVVAVRNGDALLTLVTAAGCALTALIAAFVSAAPADPLLATAHALAVFGLAGQEGLKVAPRPGPGSLRVGLLDMLHLMEQAHSLDEVESFVGISSALLVNMGTLSPEWLASKKLAAKRAVELGIPWVLDPVGCGATAVRTTACLELLRCRPAVVRGNASEVLALAGAVGSGRGV